MAKNSHLNTSQVSASSKFGQLSTAKKTLPGSTSAAGHNTSLNSLNASTLLKLRNSDEQNSSSLGLDW